MSVDQMWQDVDGLGRVKRAELQSALPRLISAHGSRSWSIRVGPEKPNDRSADEMALEHEAYNLAVVIRSSTARSADDDAGSEDTRRGRSSPAQIGGA